MLLKLKIAVCLGKRTNSVEEVHLSTAASHFALLNLLFVTSTDQKYKIKIEIGPSKGLQG